MKATNLLRSFCPPFFCLLLFASSVRADDEVANYEIHEFSLWGLDPTLEQVNQLQHYPSALPGVVETERSRVNEQKKLTPLGLITFHGEPVKDLEIDLRVQSGRFLGHWPPAESKSGRLRWLDLATVPEAAKDAFMAAVDEKHWFVAGRQLDGLFAQGKSRTERFLVYDCELKYEVPLQLTGGPDTYQVANRGKTPLLDVLIIAPAGDEGVRIGRVDSLAPAKPADSKPADSKPADSKPADSKPAESKPADAPAATDKNEASATEAPKSQQPESAVPEKKAAEEKPAEEKSADAKPANAPTEKAEAEQPAAAPQAAAAPGAPAAAQPAPAAAAQSAPAATAQPALLPGVDVEMSQPLAKDSGELKAVGESLAASLKHVGLTEKEIELLLDRGLGNLVETKEMLVLFRLPPDAIEERLPLVAYPAPRKTIRTALVLVRNLDPKIKDEVQKLIAELGAEKYSVREAAEKRLLELGRLAVPALKEAAKPANKDLEVVFRAERILLAQNEKLEGT